MINIYKINFLSFLMITFLLVSNFGCSKNKENKKMKNKEQKLPIKKLNTSQQSANNNPSKPATSAKAYDACDCNKRSQAIMDETILIREKFSNISDLKADSNAKKEIKRLAKAYNLLVGKCFEENAAKLFIESECNDLKALEEKKGLLYSMGIQIDLGANIKL
mgnify:FL=1